MSELRLSYFTRAIVMNPQAKPTGATPMPESPQQPKSAGPPDMPTPRPPETFWQLVWRVSKRPLSFGADPLVQSAAAFGINLWCLVIAVLAQFWVFLSAGLLLAQTYNTWLVANGRMRKVTALLVGLVLVGINFGALTLAVLGQFWVFASAALSAWQYVSLIRVCLRRRQA